MRRRSLSFRLLIAAGLTTFAALVITGFAISYLFELYFQKRLATELKAELTELTAAVDISSNGEISVGTMSDLRYEQPFGGLYWQVEAKEIIFSRSLWDQPIKTKTPVALGVQKKEALQAEFGADLLTLSWQVKMDNLAEGETVLLTVAADMSELYVAASEFRVNIAFWLSLLGISLVGAAWLQVRVGLRPLEQIRMDIERVTYQTGNRLPETYPTEVRPLANTINSLLENQSVTLEAARRRAGDLAHGLKTPLSILAAYASDIRADGNVEQAKQIEQQLSFMRLFVERELARSRASLSRSASTEIAPIVERMVNAISKLPGAEKIVWKIDMPEGLRAPFDAHDLSELLGNLLDNARKYATSTVSITCKRLNDASVQLIIEDDGPGMAEDDLGKAFEPGAQGANCEAGQGLGLAIVSDLLEIQNSTIEIENRTPSGFRAIVTWKLK